jgi:hypothetical protein
MTARLALALAAAAVLPLAARAQEPAGGQRFDHYRHRNLFPTCEQCHQGAGEDPDLPMWPEAESCATCHDGTTRPRVAWAPPTESRPSNIKFAHELVPLMPRQTPRGEQALTCGDCHLPADGTWMAVQRATPEGCLGCHGTGAPHLAEADDLCSTCHLPLPRARRLRLADVAAFPAPPSHGREGFSRGAGHGALATGTDDAVASSCATCHARDFCLTCHVDAPEQAAIQALAPDPRSLAIAATLRAPPSHADAGFLGSHGAAARSDAGRCATCHTRESCFACHAPSQRVATALRGPGAGRGPGAHPVRRPPDSHGESFGRGHAAAAASTPATCAGCHVRPDCLQCHRPDAAAAPGYHPAGFLTVHAASAYARETSCSGCHNVASFCQTCHLSAGLVSTRTLGSGYHDASPFFIVGHGQAARQSLETCVTCHVERDCLTCHSALGGRRASPHGPGFDPDRLGRRNPEMCAACHGRAVPGR